MISYVSALNQLISNTFESQIKEPNIRKIIVSAMEVFSKKSVEATKIKDIAQYAGFSQGYIYNYFRSKEELFSKIVELAAEGGALSIKHADSLPISPYEKLCALATVMTDLSSLSVQHFRLTLMLLSNSDSIPQKAKEANVKGSVPIMEALSKIIIDGQKSNEIIEGNPITLSITFFSLVQGLLLMKLQATNHTLFPVTEELLAYLLKK